MNQPFATISQPVCPQCGYNGVPLYCDLRDQLYGVGGKWDMSQCQNCAIAWLDPRPDDFVQLYARYYTHSPDNSQNWRDKLRRKLDLLSTISGKMALGYPAEVPLAEKIAAKLLGLFRPGCETAKMRFAGIPAPASGEVLDVGCGSGALLATLKDAGWRTVGIEIDPKAAAAARALGIEVYQGTLNSVELQRERFSYVILNHVIEHVPNPVSYLQECGKLLAPGGKLIVITPNLRGFSHINFGRFWRGLETPRHLIIFSSKALRATGESAGLSMESCATLVRGARFMYTQSVRMRAGLMDIELTSRTNLAEKVIRNIMSYIFQVIEWLAAQFNPDLGDEIMMKFSSPASRERNMQDQIQ